MYTCLSNKVDHAAHKYRRARLALMVLQPDNTWAEDFKELRKEDIRGPGIDPDDTKTSKGHFEESWIWITQWKGKNAKAETEEYKDDMRVEWVKLRACLLWWKEEVLLVKEEMQRVIEWSEWKACWWDEQASLRMNASMDILSGVQAYSHKQALMWRQLAMHCAWEWLPLLTELNMDPEWASWYPKDERLHRGGSKGQQDRTITEEDLQEEEEEGSTDEEEENMDEGNQEQGNPDAFDDFEHDD